MSDLIDRELEHRELRGLLERGVPQLALLYGRRQVGKTWLLTHTWPEDRTFYWTASATTAAQNRAQIVRDLAQWSGDDLRPDDYPTWRTVFNLLLDLRAPMPLVVVLDEFQYFGDDEHHLTQVASELNAAWERRRPRRPFVLVVSGSALGTLEGFDAGGAPLHGRFAWKGELRPFDYWYAAQMTRFRSLRDRVRAYAIFGGTPRYLAAVRANDPLGDNVARLMLAPRGEVRALVETAILQEQGLREIPKYEAIMRAIGSGRTGLNEIGQRSGLPADTSLRDKVQRLTSLGYVQQFRNLGAKSTVPFRYRIADPAFTFYYEFVARHETALERHDAKTVWREAVAPRLDTYIGRTFERVAEQAYGRMQRRLRLPLVDEWGTWEGRDRTGESLEVDVVASLTDGRVMTGAVKWNSQPLDERWHTKHMKMLERLAASGVKWAHAAHHDDAPLLYIAAGGFTKGFERAARGSRRDVYLFTLSDLFGKARPKRRAAG